MMNREKNFASAVVYIHNAQEWVGKFLETLIGVLEDNFEHAEIVCVNDCSEDGSVQAIRAASGKAVRTSVSVLNMSCFHGLELAMNAGMDLAIGDFVFEFDSTLMNYAPEEIMKVYRRALEGYDIVSAVPERKQKLSSGLFYWLFDKFSDTPQHLTTESFRVLSRRAINRVMSMNKTIPYRKAIYAGCGLKTDSICYSCLPGKGDRIDKREQGYRRGLAVDALLLFTNAGARFSGVMTALMMFAAVFMGVYSIVIYCTGAPVAGWTTTILFLSAAFFGLFAILTIVIKYLQLLIQLIHKRKNYSFESIEKLTK